MTGVKSWAYSQFLSQIVHKVSKLLILVGWEWDLNTSFGLGHRIQNYRREVRVASRIWRWKVQSRLWKSRKWQTSSDFDHWSFARGRCDKGNLLFDQSIWSGTKVKLLIKFENVRQKMSHFCFKWNQKETFLVVFKHCESFNYWIFSLSWSLFKSSQDTRMLFIWIFFRVNLNILAKNQLFYPSV